jgi:hypothetical protein
VQTFDEEDMKTYIAILITLTVLPISSRADSTFIITVHDTGTNVIHVLAGKVVTIDALQKTISKLALPFTHKVFLDNLIAPPATRSLDT